MCEFIAKRASKIDVNVTDKLTLMVLSVWADTETCECLLTYEEISNYTGQKIRTVIKNIGYLESLKLVKVEKNNGFYVFIICV